MRVDLYTKFVLTIIAAALVWICLDGVPAGTTVRAQGTQRVVVVGWESPLKGLPVFVVTQDGTAITTADGVRAVVNNGTTQPIPVGVAAVYGRTGGARPWEPLMVEIAKSPPAKIPGH